ncbi:MAG: CoA transferase subunit A [Desulfobacterales bacterium]|nr:CoA transferase subunit A [Desulfobacterales bacterium]
MNTGKNKIYTLTQAVKAYINDGDHISIGGFTINRNPMACAHEIIRQKKKNLHVYAHSNGQGVDELIGAGAVKRIEIAYSGNGRFAPTCFCFKRKIEQGELEVEDYSNYQMSLRFLAGSMGIPFMPTYSSLGTDIIKKWGFDSELRNQELKISREKIVLMDNPFFKKETLSHKNQKDQLVLVPAINPDVTIIHAQKADIEGCTKIEGLAFADVEQAKASKCVIVTCEQVVEKNELKKDPGANHIPSFCVDAVVHVPMGAYPTACYKYYDYDPVFLEWYKDIAVDNGKFVEYLNDYIFGTKNHSEFLNKITDTKRIEDIKADFETGYSIGMKRK